jgi:hypothetical protein
VFGDMHVYHSFVHKSLVQRTKLNARMFFLIITIIQRCVHYQVHLENVEMHINCTMILSYTIFVYVAKELHAFKFQSYILKLQWCLSVCLSIRAVPGKFFQALPVPCGVFCRRGVGGG